MKKKIVLLAATPLEVPGELTELYGFPIYYTGVGKINAAKTTAWVAMMREPDVIINFGSCGCLNEDIEPGRLLDVGYVNNDIEAYPFAPYGVTPFSNDKGIALASPSSVSCLTADRFYDKYRTDYSKAYLNKLKEVTIVDMELYAIAQVCKEYGIKCISYKWVSDAGIADQWTENKTKGFDKFAKKLNYESENY